LAGSNRSGEFWSVEWKSNRQPVSRIGTLHLQGDDREMAEPHPEPRKSDGTDFRMRSHGSAGSY